MTFREGGVSAQRTLFQMSELDWEWERDPEQQNGAAKETMSPRDNSKRQGWGGIRVAVTVWSEGEGVVGIGAIIATCSVYVCI